MTTAVAQAVLLREAMAALGGSELTWGAVLALWLGGMGAGAWLGTHRGTWPRAALAPAAVALVAAVGVVLMRAAPVLAGATAGEAATTWRGVWVWAVAVAVPAAVGGWCFPVAAEALSTGGGAAVAYGLESTGAMVGGVLFTFVLAAGGSLTAVGVACAAALGAWLLTRGWLWAAALPLALVIPAARPLERALAVDGWRWSGRAGELAAWRETREQRLELATGPPAALYADGRLVASIPDPYRAPAMAHLALLVCPNPVRVLLVGGVVDGTVPAMLREPGVRVTVAEEDPGLARVLPVWAGGRTAAAFANPRVTLVTSDPLRVVRSAGPWDEIVLFDGDPTTLRRNRTRTAEFFRACAHALAAQGVLVVRVGVSDTYLGGAGGRLLAITASTLHQAFPKVVALPGEEVVLVAGQDAAWLTGDPAVLQARWRARGAADPEFAPEMIPLLVDPGRARSLDAFLRAHPTAVNRARHPRAVLLAAALHEARGSPPLLAAARAVEAASISPLVVCLAVVLVFLLARGTRRANLGVDAAAVVGFSSMTWWLLLLAVWQATMGSVYAEVGALSATFMAGVLAGVTGARRLSLLRSTSLARTLVVGSCLSLLMATGVPLAWPRTTVVPLLLLAGVLTGAAFPAVAGLAARGNVRRGAGMGFGADEAGAGAAALAVGLFVLPWAGLAAVAVGIACLQLGTAAAVVLAARRP
jgi:predicted membrane-bound spermidine synthase